MLSVTISFNYKNLNLLPVWAKHRGNVQRRCTAICRLSGAFSELLTAVPRNPRFLKFLAGGETTRKRFMGTLLVEEGGHAVCQSQRADAEGEQFLLLPDVCTTDRR
ncbi:MAG: hypothetical protein PVH54_10240 [Gammaproteobacteria bacterium]|jgi:hypothetical protein